MLYKFKSRATADVIMLEANARQLLKIAGKGDEPHGIITAAQIPAAIEALQSAVAADEAADRAQDAQPGAQDEREAQQDEGAPREPVRLHQRAAPFIDMLRRSAAEGHDVIW
ncbi:protein of unknown function [Oryzisolibacter propanilivorax]|uniref:DUF1840 domain-containing protein n=1 Tax=Oryzisolibacter propanilivorax TaxID=1527607 RepID=A0A1G9SAI4_9BURK|nr:DUF1840 domain-containing protein [Oryzisolibacter propanilivorax]SDM32429.1 protein of unknown function [Oryzisolibacter propanilivorax]